MLVIMQLIAGLAIAVAPVDSALPPDGAAPLDDVRTPSNAPAPVPSEGVAPLDEIETSDKSSLPPAGIAPLDHPVLEPRDELPRGAISRPLGYLPATPAPTLDRKGLSIVRMDFLTGPIWRLRAIDTLFSTSVEYGRMHGFSGAFHTGIVIASDRLVVEALDFPIGLGAIVRGRMRRHPLYASVGLTAGLLVHRAATERGVIRRVDPDLRMPIRFAWTIAGIGLSVAVEQGYSVRSRSYDRRGVEVWARHAYRIGFVVGLHCDVRARSLSIGPGTRKVRR